MEESSVTTTYHLRIVAESSASGDSGWEVAVYLGGACFAKNITLSDPFTKAEEDECRWYLEDYLTKSPFERGRAEVAVEDLNLYADKLFNQLHLSRVWRRLTGPTSSSCKVLQIDIIEDPKDRTAVSAATIHRLHWEVLEWPRLWKNIKLQIGVRRIIPQNEASTLSTNRVESWSTGAPLVNVLLVISRRLIDQGGDEVDPKLALETLQSLKNDLETRGALFRLNIEIVRPGSFKALKKHLEERTRHRHRHRGDIHIIHFDVHGRVGLRNEKGEDRVTTAAFLYFQSGKGDGRLVPTRAGAVADLLRKYNIRIAVLNACESAKANKGDEANLASVFVKAGVQNVLAMAYRTLGSTSTKFMRSFYESLIADAKPFSIAVRDAREQLRQSPTRDARFALNRPLEDWIVPVVYAGGKDIELCITRTPTKDPAIKSPPLTTSPEVIPAKTFPRLFGRGFDILRFETIFLASDIVRVSGPAGIGKTVFIQHLVRSWKNTGLFENTIYVDCSSIYVQGIETPGALLQQLFSKTPGLPRNDSSNDDEAIYRHNLSELGENFQVMVFDNLEASHSDFSEMDEYGRWPETTRSAFNTLMKDIIRVRSQHDESPSIILVGRRDDDGWWESHFPDIFTYSRHQLKGLALPDAIEFSHSLLEDLGLGTSHWDYDDENILSQVLDILQCNPLAINIVLPAVVSQNHPWKQLFDHILFHQFTGAWPLHNYECKFLTRDMMFGSNSGPLSTLHAITYSSLALFWHVGPSKDFFKQWLEASPEDPGCHAIEFGVDRGYFNLDRQGNVEQIHPLFTLLGRSIFPLQPGIPHIGAVWAMVADQDSVPDQFVIWCMELFFRGISSRDLNEPIQRLNNAGKYHEFEKELRPSFYNILTCLRLCSMGKHLVCIASWPDNLVMFAFAGSYFLSVYEMDILVKHYEHFLRRFICRRTNTTDAHTLFLLISIGNSLTTAHWTLSTLPTKRAQDFSQLTFNIIDETPDELREQKSLVGIISYAIMNQGFAELAQGTRTFGECEASGNPIPGLLSQFQSSEEKSLLSSLTWNEFSNPNHMPNFQQRVPQMETIMAKRSIQAYVSEVQESIAKGANSVELMTTALRGSSLTSSDLERYDEWSNLLAHAQSSQSTIRSSDLEYSLDVRNRLDAITHLKALLTNAMEEGDLELVVELLSSLIAIYQTDERFAEDLSEARKLKNKFETNIRTLQLCISVAGPSNSPSTNQAFLEDIKIMEFRRHQQEDHDVIREHIYTVLKKKQTKGDVGAEVEEPKRRLKSVLKGLSTHAATPEGEAKMFEYGVQLIALTKELDQLIEAGDFETAVITLEKVAEIKNPAPLIDMPPLDIAKQRQILISSRDFKKAQIPLNQAMQENRVEDAISIAEDLLRAQAAGKYPGLIDGLAQNTRHILERLIWFQHANTWELAFLADDYSNALTEIRTLRRLEMSSALDAPIQTPSGTFLAREATEWNYLRTLHRHLGESRRPRLALKTVSYLLQQYDHFEDIAPPVWLLPELLDEERGYKWLYDIEVEREAYMHSLVVQRDRDTAYQHLETIRKMMTEKVPQTIPHKELSRVDFDHDRRLFDGL